MTKSQLKLWRKPGARLTRRELRTQFQRFIWSSVFLAAYFIVVIPFLNGSEDPGDDSNILMVLVGAIAVGSLGGWLGPKVPAILRIQPYQSKRRSKPAKSDRH